MKNDVRGYRLPTSFFISNRARLEKQLPERALALFFAGRAPLMSADAHYPFFANRNFFYLTGLEIEDSVLVIHKHKDIARSTLFILSPDPSVERWTGRRLRKDEAQRLSGVTDVQYLPVIEDVLKPIISDEAMPIAYGKDVLPFIALFPRLKMAINDGRPTLDTQPILTLLRMIKEPCEIKMIEKAIRLTIDAIDAVRPLIRPGAKELSIHSAFLYELNKRGCFVPAFDPVIATGAHTLCLHHPHPEGKLKDGDLLQMDVGARVGGLCADLSRVFCVGDAFDERQKKLHDAVMRCQKTAFEAICPGVTLEQIDEACRKKAQYELETIGLLADTSSTLSSYYWHRVSHHLGHDVHDIHLRDAVLKPGVVLTVEPGLYIPQWGFGIRIEDDIVVTSDGCRILSHLKSTQGGT